MNQSSIFKLNKAPILQNKVYESREAANNASYGSLDIDTDKNTSLYINKDFDPDLMVYDQDYDNSVPSKVFMDYYDEIADYLVGKYDLNAHKLVDLGCGKGTFLSKLATRYEFVEGLGIDPSYQGESTILDGRVQFIQEYFSKEHIETLEKPAFVICRHTLEHIPNPDLFLQHIFDNFATKQNKTKYFIEVPDLSWTLENKAFWDFCYEHVNYFNPESLRQCITRAGGKVLKISHGFNNQYLWAEVVVDTKARNDTLDDLSSADLKSKAVNSGELVEHISDIAQKLKTVSETQKIIVWGMATKGIMYCLNLSDYGVEVHACVDINENKQNKYIPILGYKITSPNTLTPEKNYAVICMNPNYIPEIKTHCQQLKLTADFYNPDITLYR